MSAKNRILTAILLILAITAISPAPNIALAHDAQTNIKNENDYYRNLAQKNKQAVVVIRAEIDPAKSRKTGEQNNFPLKKSMPNVVLPVYIEKIFSEELGMVQSFSTGTGFIITPDGEILTNFHVIDGHKEIYVILANDSVFKADVVGFDQSADVALLKIQTENPNFPVLTLGDSNAVAEPDPIIITGHPFGLNYSVSIGTISGLKRVITLRLPPLIQVQSSINPGNSGSPLITVYDNKVVGIIQSMADDANQIAFAVPINFVKSILPSLRNQKGQKNNTEK